MYVKSFLIKLVMITAVLWIVLGLFYDVNLADILWLSVTLTVVGFIGDVIVMPRTGNVLAAIGDFLIAFAAIWYLGSIIIEETLPIGTAAFISALLIMMGEFYLHRYMKNNILEPRKKNPKEKVGYYQRTNLQTEFAKEVDIEDMSTEAKAEEPSSK